MSTLPTPSTLHHLKLVCRWSLGFVWIWEGLVPKILGPTEMQRQLVIESGLYWPDPDRFLFALGIAMIAFGLVLCVGWFERLAALAASVAMSLLICLVVGFRPESLFDMHGGIAKDACLYAAAWVVWVLGARKE